ncbi:MAG: PTS sugar transporter subunit IIA [Ignavibacteriales bacterium]
MTTAILDPGRVVLGATARDKTMAIEMVGGLLVRDGLADEGYVQSMLEREASMSTYVGSGIAIPHGMTADLVRETGLALVQFPAGVKFGDEIAHVLIGIAAKGDEHLGVLSNLAEVLKDGFTAGRLCRATSSQEVMDLLCRPSSWEGERP